MPQLTLRGLEPELDRALHELARKESISLNKAALKLMRRGAGLTEHGRSAAIGDALDDWIGHLSCADARAITEAVEELDRLSQ